MNKQPVILILIAFLAILVTACGPAVTGSPGAENEAETDSTIRDIVVSAPETDAELTVSGEGTEFDGTEYDANGIEVGFTEDGRPYRGSRHAPVVLEEFSDFQCPFCARYAGETLPYLMAKQIADGEVTTIFYDFPLTNLHPQAVGAAHAARCAGEQGAVAYWEMHDKIFVSTSEWANNNADAVFTAYAEALSLDTAAFEACQSSAKYEQAIEDDISLGRSRGVSSTPSFFVNDQPLIGAQPLSVFDQVIEATLNGDVVAAQPDQPSPPAQPAVAPTPATIPTDNFAAALGDPNAPVTIVEYTDYQCPFCQRYSQETMPQMITELIETGRVYYMLKDFPLDQIHPNARAAASAARCAGDQGSYWEMHDAIFNNQSAWADTAAAAVLTDIASNLGLDMDSYNTCIDGRKYDNAIQGNLEEGSRLGVRGTPAFFIDGYPISGAQPFEMFAYGVGLAEEGTLAEAYVPRETPPEPTRPAGPVVVPIGDAFSIGNPDAPVTIVEYTDFQCPFCSRYFQQTFPSIQENYVDEGLVRYVFKDFPLTSIHPQAVGASMAARCAGDQEAYLEMHDLLFATQGEWSGQGNATALFVGYASQLGLDKNVFTTCMESNKYETAVMADLEEGASLGVRGTPAFFINGNFVSGAQPYAAFEEAIDLALAQ